MNSGSVILFGASGLLGSSVHNELMSRRFGVIPVSRKQIDSGYIDSRLFCQNLDPGKENFLVFAGGNTSRDENSSVILRDNFEIPVHIIRKMADRFTFKFFTFGSVFECIKCPELLTIYIESKRQLARWIQRWNQIERKCKGTHIRLHTLYGTVQNNQSHMFLGQIIDALMRGDDFHMSDGNQLREYHHVEDVASVIADLIQDWRELPSVINLNSGNPVTLRSIAYHLFEIFSDVSRIKHTLSGTDENYSVVFKKSKHLSTSRDALTGVESVVRWHLQQERSNKNGVFSG